MTSTAPSTPPPVPPARKWRRYVVLGGILLALVCKSLPPDYQGPCSAVANLCSGGLLP